MPTKPILGFIPGLHNLTAPSSRPSPAPTHPFCPSRHALVTPPIPNPPARFNPPPRGRRVAPSTVIATPATSVTRSTLPLLHPESRTGHKHTAESKRKISVANRGNVPWNKGLKHSEETKKKISEATRRAMLSPEMRERLKIRARGRKHSEATKLKIRETARATRGKAMKSSRKKKTPVPFAYSPEVVVDLNKRVDRQLSEGFVKAENEPTKLMVREKGPMSEETRQKLSKRIKEMWNDPEYRMKVAEGIEQRQMKLKIGKYKQNIKGEPVTSNVVNSPRRKARVPRNADRRVGRDKVMGEESRRSDAREEDEDVEEEDSGLYAALDDDVVLDFDSVGGLTKEDLGLFGTQNGGEVDNVGTVRGARGTRHVRSKGKEVTRKRNSSDDDLLKSLRDAGQLPSLQGESFVGSMSGGQNLFDFNDASLDPLELPNSQRDQSTEASISGPHEQKGDDMVFFGRPMDIASSPAVDLASPYLSVGPPKEVEEFSTPAEGGTEFGNGSDLLGNPAGADRGFRADKISLNYVDDNFSGLDIYDAGSKLDLTMKPSSALLDLDTRQGDFAHNSNKSQ